MEHNFITSRQRLWDRLCDLANKQHKTESERIEETIKSREFFELILVEQSIEFIDKQINIYDTTELQKAITEMARINNYIRY